MTVGDAVDGWSISYTELPRGTLQPHSLRAVFLSRKPVLSFRCVFFLCKHMKFPSRHHIPSLQIRHVRTDRAALLSQGETTSSA